MTDLETALRAVPCRACGVLHYAHPGWAPGSQTSHEFIPDYPALAAIVQGMVEERLDLNKSWWTDDQLMARLAKIYTECERRELTFTVVCPTCGERTQ